MPEPSPPCMRIALTGPDQASASLAIPLAAEVVEVMQLLEQGHYLTGEVLLKRDRPWRWTERDDRYQECVVAMHPGQERVEAPSRRGIADPVEV